MLDELIARLRSGEMTLAEFAQAAAAAWRPDTYPQYPETDYKPNPGISAAQLDNARMFGQLTAAEVDAVRAVIAADTP